MGSCGLGQLASVMMDFQIVHLLYWQPSFRNLVSLINRIWLSGEVRYKTRPLGPRKLSILLLTHLMTGLATF
jgi:hypothetical protein